MGAGNSQSKGLDSPTFLKASSDVIDINAHGALTVFLIAKSNELSAGALAPKLSSQNLQLFNHDTLEFVKVDKSIWDNLKNYSAQHPTVKSSEVVVDEAIEKACAPFIFDAPKAFEVREDIKAKTNGESVVLVSMVVSSNNLSGWMKTQGDSTTAKRAVKVTEKKVKSLGAKWTTYTRLFATPAKRGLIGSPISINYHIALMQMTSDDMLLGITSSNVVKVDKLSGSVSEGSIGADQYTRLQELFQQSVRGDEKAYKDLKDLVDQVVEPTDHKTSGQDKFVVLLSGNNQVSVQLISQLGDATQEKINKSKLELPTSVMAGSRVCSKRGTMLKHADGAYLGIVDFDGKSVAVQRYE